MKVYEIRLQYRKVLEISVIMSLLIVTLMMRFVRIEERTTQIKKISLQIDITDIERTEQLKRTAPPQRPVVPMVSDSENLLGDETIDDTEIDLKEIPPPPPPPKKEDRAKKIEMFVAFDTPPQLKGGDAFIRKNLKYPEEARKKKMEGQVQVKAIIDENGNVSGAEVLKAEGHPDFGQAAVDVVMKCKFTPAKQKNKPVKISYVVTVPFKLK